MMLVKKMIKEARCLKESIFGERFRLARKERAKMLRVSSRVEIDFENVQVMGWGR